MSLVLLKKLNSKNPDYRDNPQLNNMSITTKYGFIYILTNDINNKKYIGQTIKTFEKRLEQHCYEAQRYEYSSMPIARAIRKYGIDKFRKIHVKLPVQYLDDMEVKFIKAFNTQAPNGYNIMSGGAGATIDKHRIEKFINGRINIDPDHELPSYIKYVGENEFAGYQIYSPEHRFIQISSKYLTKEEKYNFAMEYYNNKDYDTIYKKYLDLKCIRKRESINKEEVIDGETYIMPAHFIWCPGEGTGKKKRGKIVNEKFFYVRVPGTKFKQFGDWKRYTIRQNYERALEYYNKCIEQAKNNTPEGAVLRNKKKSTRKTIEI
jgi:group I intron endonuclease